jgi:hypothetical protein
MYTGASLTLKCSSSPPPKLGVAPAHCIVVEDAQHGVEAARAAGMKSIGVSQNCKLLPADVVVRSLDLLEPNAFNTVLQDGASSAFTHAFPFHQ